MAIYKTRWFDRWARKEGLTTASLCTAVQEMAAGLFEADLGGGLVHCVIELAPAECAVTGRRTST